MNNRYNGSGYKDLTAHAAIENIDKKNKEVNERAKNTIKLAKSLIELGGFDVMGRIGIKDKETGREYK